MCIRDSIRRWALALSEYDFEIRYVPGASHHLADYSSRAIDEQAETDDKECEPDVGFELLAVDGPYPDLDDPDDIPPGQASQSSQDSQEEDPTVSKDLSNQVILAAQKKDKCMV